MTSNLNYEKLIQAWSIAVNSSRAKHHLELVNDSQSNKEQHKVTGWINVEHHILYNILLNRDPFSGLSMVTNHIKLKNNMLPNHGYNIGVYRLQHYINYAKHLLKDSNQVNEYHYSSVASFLEPFDDTVSIEVLSTIQLPKLPTIQEN